MKRITLPEIKTLAESAGLEFEIVRAVISVECSGSGFNEKTGLIKIQFEPAHFQKRAGILIKNGVEGQGAEWESFKKALSINEHAAYSATSFGMGQIMGFNHKRAGFNTPKEMYENFCKSEYNQIKGMLSFIRSNTDMFKALKEKNWADFARLYNGPKFKDFKYDTKIQTEYNKIKQS